MSFRPFLATAGALAVLSFASGAAASVNIVVNPGFETGGLAPWVSNQNTDHPWGIGPVDIPVHSGQFDAQTGCVGAHCTDESNLGNTADLYQDLATSSGQHYDLSFWFAGDGATDGLKVLWGSSVVLDLSNGQIVHNPGDGSETLYSVSNLLATSGTTRLSFLGRQDPGYNGLDDVSVVANGNSTGVPEPAAWTMMILGFAGVGAALRRRRDRTAALSV